MHTHLENSSASQVIGQLVIRIADKTNKKYLL